MTLQTILNLYLPNPNEVLRLSHLFNLLSETILEKIEFTIINPLGQTILHESTKNTNKVSFDLSSLTDAERKARIEKRKPKRQIKIEAEVEDNFSAKKYMKYLKKN